MSAKQLVWIGAIVGSTIGGFIPSLWGAGLISFSSMFLSALGAFVGIWFGYQLSQRM